jgi:ADP-ribose pyrophosphatase
MDVDTAEQWPVESSSTRFEGGVISVRSDVVRSPVDGATFVRDIVVHPGAVAVVALDDNNVLTVSQYRHPVGRRLIELPAGLRDVPGEPLQACAARELYEEGHVRAAEWRELIEIYPSPGMTDEVIQIFVARGITAVPEDERHNGTKEEADMPVIWIPLEDLVAKVLAGEVHNGITSAGVLATWAVQQRPGGLAALPGGPGLAE